MYIAPVQGGREPPGDKVLVSTETSCSFDHPLLVKIIDDNSF